MPSIFHIQKKIVRPHEKLAQSLIYDLENSICSIENTEQKLLAAEALGKLLWNCPKGVYALPKIEDQLVERLSSSRPCKETNGDYLFLITEAYSSGGHTRLMERLAKQMPSRPSLVITRSATSETIQRLDKIFNIFDLTKESRLENKARKILDIVNKYKFIVLNTHPDDITAVAAVGAIKLANKNITVGFINHADHAFSYGSSVSDIWFTISNFGEAIDKKRNIKGQASFLGTPLDFPEIKHPLPSPPETVRVILSGGSKNKYKMRKLLSPIPLFYRLHRKYPSADIFIIGPKKFSFFSLIMRMITLGRIKTLNILAYESYLEMAKKADIYVDSYPMIGGSAFVEQLAKGKYCLGIDSPALGHSPADLIRLPSSRNISLKSYPPNLMSEIEKVHDAKSVYIRFSSAMEHRKIHENPLRNQPKSRYDDSFFNTFGFRESLINRYLSIAFSIRSTIKMFAISPLSSLKIILLKLSA